MFRLKILFRSPTHTTMKRKTIGMVLLGLAAFALVGSGAAKLFAEPEAGMPARFLAMKSYLAIIEFLIVIALAIPKTRKLGIILAASYFGGVIAFQWLIEGQAFPLVGVILNTLLYAGAALYYPSVTDGGSGVAD
jgi:hypothetical protein